MSDRERQNQIAETLSLLGQLTPADLAANRDELFFRAGEASARAERCQSSSASHRLWQCAAAILAVIAAGLGMTLLIRQPQLQVVYVERDANDAGPSSAAVDDAPSRPRPDRNGHQAPFESPYVLDVIRRDLATDGMIDRRDWAALSDAFAQQMRLQQERRQRAQYELVTTAANDDNQAPREAGRRTRARTYLELRDALQAM